MNRIDDPKIAFYLKNQALIEEWSRLAKGASSVVDTFLCSCERDLAQLAKGFSPNASLIVQLEGDYPKILLYQPAWIRSNGPPIELHAGIGLEWHRDTGLGFAQSPNCAYAGVWTNLHVDSGKNLSRNLRRAFGDAGLSRQHGLVSHEWWPAYRYEMATGEFWNDLNVYRLQLVESVRFFWTTFAPKVQEAVAAAGGNASQ